jgi:hypothetical protein
MSINDMNGAPGTIRTSDPQIRSLVLYPAELRARVSLFSCRARGPAAFRQFDRRSAKERSSYPLRLRLARCSSRPKLQIARFRCHSGAPQRRRTRKSRAATSGFQVRGRWGANRTGLAPE